MIIFDQHLQQIKNVFVNCMHDWKYKLKGIGSCHFAWGWVHLKKYHMRVHSSDGASTNLICQKIKDRPYSTCYNLHGTSKSQNPGFSNRYIPADPSLRHTVLLSSLVVEVGIYLSHSIIHPPCIVIKFCN